MCLENHRTATVSAISGKNSSDGTRNASREDRHTGAANPHFKNPLKSRILRQTTWGLFFGLFYRASSRRRVLGDLPVSRQIHPMKIKSLLEQTAPEFQTLTLSMLIGLTRAKAIAKNRVISWMPTAPPTPPAVLSPLPWPSPSPFEPRRWSPGDPSPARRDTLSLTPSPRMPSASSNRYSALQCSERRLFRRDVLRKCMGYDPRTAHLK